MAIIAKDCFLFCKSTSCPGFIPSYYFSVDNRDRPAYQRFVFSHVHGIRNTNCNAYVSEMAIMAKDCFLFCKSTSCPGFIPSYYISVDNRDRPAYQRFVLSHVHGIRNTNYDAYVSEMAIMVKDCFLFCKSTSCPGFIPSYYFSVDNRDRPAYQRFVFSHVHGIRNTNYDAYVSEMAIIAKDCFLFCKSTSCPGFIPSYYFSVDNRDRPAYQRFVFSHVHGIRNTNCDAYVSEMAIIAKDCFLFCKSTSCPGFIPSYYFSVDNRDRPAYQRFVFSHVHGIRNTNYDAYVSEMAIIAKDCFLFCKSTSCPGFIPSYYFSVDNRDHPVYQRFVFSHVHGIRNTNYDAYVSEMAIIAKDCFLFCKSTSCPGFIPCYYISVNNRDRPAYQRFVFSHVHGIRNTNCNAYVSELAIMAKDCFLFCKSTSCPGFIPSYYFSVDNRDRPAY